MYNQYPQQNQYPPQQGMPTYSYPQQGPYQQPQPYQQPSVVVVTQQPQYMVPQQQPQYVMVQPVQPAQPNYYAQPVIQPQPVINSPNTMHHQTELVAKQTHMEMQITNEANSNIRALARSKVPSIIKCESCGQVGMTTVKHEVGSGSWALGAILCCFGMVPCAFLPCCMSDCQDTQHFCGQCGAKGGRLNFLFDNNI